MVDYTRVARLKIPILETIFKSWNEQRESSEWQRFEAFRRVAPESFERSCLFLALREHFAASDTGRWPIGEIGRQISRARSRRR